MSTQVQRRRGNTAQHAAFIGAVGETTYDSDFKRLVAHDGFTLGGLPAAHLHVANIFSQPQTIAVASGAPTVAFDILTDSVSRFQVRKSGFGVFHRQEADVSPGGIELTKRGNAGSATGALSSGSAISTIDWLGWDGAALGGAGGIRMFTSQAWVPGAHGSKLFFTTVPAGSTSTVNSMELDNTALTVLSRLLLPNTTSATVGGIYFGGNRAFHNFGTNNTSAGVNAGNLTMTGAQNSFFGAGTGAANTTGASNSFFGFQAGLGNTSGGYNSFFGRSAGQSTTTGANNSFFGVSAGAANTTGPDNSFFGTNSGQANTTGGYNSFFGRNSGVANTTGALNSFFGRNAGAANTTGANNSFFGRSSGAGNTTGSNNSFFGLNSGVANTTGTYNSFFGRSAGSLNTTGSNNTTVGGLAGDNLTTGNNNIVLGYGIDSPTAVNSNTLTIGNLIFGTGVDGTGVAISSGNVGIGVITPLSRLHVGGLLRVDTGFFNNAGGFKHARVTTGSVGAGSTALVTITWATAFADTNYTVNASVLEATTSSLSMSVVHVESITAAAVTVRVLNNAVGSLTGTVHVIAVHD